MQLQTIDRRGYRRRLDAGMSPPQLIRVTADQISTQVQHDADALPRMDGVGHQTVADSFRRSTPTAAPSPQHARPRGARR